MNLYLLRVGADGTKAGGGFWSRIYPDESYVFIPIPERKEKLDENKRNKWKIYEGYKWNNHSVLQAIPNRIWGEDATQQFIHDDPEFKTFTYGSPEFNLDDPNKGTEKNFQKIYQLKNGDMLAFYAAFTDDGTTIKGYYFFAYFIIDRVVTLKNKITKEDEGLIKNNHHFIHKEQLHHNQVIVKGNGESKVLDKAVLLNSREKDRKGSNYYPCKDMQRLLGGYNKAMNRNAIRKIDDLTEKDILRFKQYLDNNGN